MAASKPVEAPEAYQSNEDLNHRFSHVPPTGWTDPGFTKQLTQKKA